MNQPPLIKQRNTNLAICKAIAIILMCAGHAEGPTLLVTFIYLFHMPVFFIAAGYFFDKKYLSDPWTFCKKRFQGLYVPFVKWSLFFLVFHNLFFKIGLMNEQYGNWSGGLTHPYSWYQFWQRLVHIIFSMGGYDEFLAGAFWFFRALLLASIVFLVLYLLLYNRRHWLNHDTVPIVIAVLAVGFAWFKVANHLNIITVVQGGIRECWGVLFFALGVLYRRHESRIPEHWALTLLYFGLLLVGAYLGFQGMALGVQLRTVATLPVTGAIGFLMVQSASEVVQAFFVKKDKHGQGIGEQLLSAYQKDFPESDLKFEVLPCDSELIAFLIAHGYGTISTIELHHDCEEQSNSWSDGTHTFHF